MFSSSCILWIFADNDCFIVPINAIIQFYTLLKGKEKVRKKAISLSDCTLQSTFPKTFRETFHGNRSVLANRLDTRHGLLDELLQRGVLLAAHCEDICQVYKFIMALTSCRKTSKLCLIDLWKVNFLWDYKYEE